MDCTNPLLHTSLRAAGVLLLLPCAAAAGTAIESLKVLSVDQLLDLEIYSASRRTDLGASTFFATSGIPTEVQRSIFGKVTWRF